MSEYASQHGRAPFDASGRLVVRRAGLRHGDRVYGLSEELVGPKLEPRTIAVLWDQGWIDTLPREPDDAELERLTAPPKAKPAARR